MTDDNATPILLDHNATTPVAPDVLEAMLPYWRTHFGNPSSVHAYGAAPKKALATARGQVSSLIGAHPDEIVFVGGGSEADNWAIKGIIDARRNEGRNHIVISRIEHPAVRAPAEYLVNKGEASLTVLDVDDAGTVRAEDAAAAFTPQTALCSVMHANNESGVVQPVAAVAAAARSAAVVMHTDAAQSAGKIAIDVNALDVDLLTLAGHKLYAPKGVGALYIRRGVAIEPLIHGGGQEGGRRAGTENIAYAVGLGAASALAQRNLQQAQSLAALRDRLAAALRDALGPRLHVTGGEGAERLPNTLSVCVEGVVGADVLAACPGLAASTGSACHEGEVRLSPVLEAMRISPDLGKGALRLTLGMTTTPADIDAAARALIAAMS